MVEMTISSAVTAASASTAADVSVCICTYRRSQAVDTVRSVLSQDGVGEIVKEIIVVDDDPDRSAEDAIAAVAREAPVTVRYVACGSRNVARARNACLDAAQGAWIAFIDDDEIAEAGWLRALLDVRAQSDADVVKGYVHGRYPPDTPLWLSRGDPYTRDYGADGEDAPRVATGNVLFRRALIEGGRIRFNPIYGCSGGEDSDFFRQIRQAGAKIVASRSAVVHEIVPASRMAGAYLRKRYRLYGQTDGKKIRIGSGETSAGRSVAVALLGISLLWFYPLLCAFGHRSAFRVFSKFWHSIGLLEGILGLERPGPNAGF